MARVNLEESVKRHCLRIAKVMGWSHREAYGTLGLVYGLTQEAGIYEDTADRIVTVCALEFDDDSQAQRFITAMISAQLAVVLEDGRIRIKGNKEHIERLQSYRKRASLGGKRAAAVRYKNSNDFVSNSLANAQAPAQAIAQHSFTPLQDPLTPQVGNSLTQAQTTALGDIGSPKKKKRSRQDGTSPRQLGTNPRALKRAKREAERVAKLQRLDDLRKDALPVPAALAELEKLRTKFRF